MKYEFTILVPLYNEEPNLLRVEQELDLYIKKAPVKTCVLFINDGSTDNSLQLVQEISRRNEAFKFISFDRNYGLSSAIKAGFDHADTPLIGYIDSDLQTDPEDFNLLLQHIGEYDLVTGMRTNRKDSVKKNLSSLIANGIRRSFTQDGMDDTGCPLKVIKADYAKRIPMFKGLHRFLPAMVLLQNGRVKQVPVRHYARIAGKAKFHLLNRLAGPLVDCFAFLWMKRSYINYKVAEKNE
ncbi:glycosyltransferase [Salinimicrobium sp. MT39]|uniref:Glycosyltransferase n=1 Tax=Salinimicrobium profundisediminis TaxID=2994553 RepID=A0A9X3HZB1_9FLAO|nr:glycosyltransferase [Salinimicrobium profundisediminis]MCX2836735.1 glycosyltransferase [Salinimicrobium profundisediminis]